MQLVFHPKTAYRHTSYHKQTKNQWARDDPAFVVVCAAFQAIAATAYCVTYGAVTCCHAIAAALHPQRNQRAAGLGFFDAVYSIFSAVFIDFLTVGALVATATW